MNFLLFFGQNLDIAAELDYFKNFWEHFLITKFDCASFAPLAITVSWKLTELERICGRGVPWNMKPECDILSYLLHKIDYRSFLYSVFLQNIFHWSSILNIYAEKLDILTFEYLEKIVLYSLNGQNYGVCVYTWRELNWWSKNYNTYPYQPFISNKSLRCIKYVYYLHLLMYL